jgi:hypothetical protein
MGLYYLRPAIGESGGHPDDDPAEAYAQADLQRTATSAPRWGKKRGGPFLCFVYAILFRFHYHDVGLRRCGRDGPAGVGGRGFGCGRGVRRRGPRIGAVDGDALPPGKNRRRIALYVAVGLLSPCWLCGVPLLALQIMYVALFHLGRVSAARATLRWSHVLFLVDAGCGCAVMLCAAAFLIGALVYSWTDAAVNGL